MNIATRTFGPGSPCIAAEMSCSHSGREDLAHALIDAAKEAGADAVKFQLYEPADLTIDSDLPHFRLTEGAWAGRTLWDLYEQAKTPRSWFPGLFAHAREVGLIPFASVFSLEGVGYLEALDCPAYKIASAEVVCLDIVRAAAQTGKPVILSDGCATPRQMVDALGAICSVRADWKEQTCCLRCVAEYPADPASYGLAPDGWNPHPWGVSDHSTNALVPAVAAALGASMVEAHLMLDASTYLAAASPFPLDAGHSYFPVEFAEMVDAVRLAARIAHGPHTEQRTTQGFRRRLVWARDLPAGHVVTPEDVLCVRCGEGAEPDVDIEGRVLRLAEDVEKWGPVSVRS